MCAHSSYALPCNFDVPRNVVRWCVSVLWHTCLAYRAHCRKRACALGYGLRCKGFANCAHCARRGDDAPGVGTNQSARHAQCPRRRCTQCVHSFFVERGSLDATLHALPCASAHVFAHAIQSALERGMRAASLYERSSNCAHQGPAAKSGTKTCPRFGDTILARFARSCKRRRARGMRAARTRNARRAGSLFALVCSCAWYARTDYVSVQAIARIRGPLQNAAPKHVTVLGTRS